MVKKYIAYFLLCFLIWICSVLYSSYEMLLIVIILLVLPLFLLGVLGIAKKKIAMNIEILENSVQVKENISLEIQVDNRSIFPIILLEIQLKSHNEFYGDIKKDKIEVMTLKYGKQSFTYMLKSKYCGTVEIQIKDVYLKDYFGLVRFKKQENISKRIEILPKVHFLECEKVTSNPRVFLDSDEFSKTEKGSDPSEIFDYRQFKEGDELSRINWKMSAKCDDYIVKELSMPISNGIVILLDLYCSSKDISNRKKVDIMISSALSISIKLQELGFKHHLVWYDIESDRCKFVNVTSDTLVEEIVKEVFCSKIYYENDVFLEKYNEEIGTINETHAFYITMEYSEESIFNLLAKRDNVIKNYLYIFDNELSKDIVDKITANDIILQPISCKNVEDSINSIYL